MLKKQLVFFKLLVFVVAVLTLAGCNNVPKVERASVSIDTNAYYTAYQKDPGSTWQQINFNNDKFILETLTFTLEEFTDPYAVVFVCPSRRRDLPHDIFVYYATAEEMRLIDFKCRKAPDEIIKRSLYGSINGVQPATISNPQGELVHLALSLNDSFNVLEAYAAVVTSGRRDAVAYKGKHSPLGNYVESPETFYIRRGIATAITEKAERRDFGFGEFGGYTADFDPAARSTVNVTGFAATDILSSEVNFLSTNKSLLNLIETTQPTFEFIPVPLDTYTGLHDGFSNANEFNPGEGHELKVSVHSASGELDREAIKFFTNSTAQSHNIVLPKVINFLPTMSLSKTDKYQSINVAWDEYADPSVGDTRLYRWVFEGQAAKLDDGVQTKVDVSKVRWNVYVTPGWAKKQTRTAGSFVINLPVNYISSASVDGKPVNVWSDDWSFQNNTPVSWELTVFSTSDKGSSGAVVEYLLNRNIVENYSFSQVRARSTIVPAS